MMTRYDARLNAKSLAAIDPTIYVQDITHDTPQETEESVELLTRPGTILRRKMRRSTSVIITLEIHEYNTGRRQYVARRIAEWAKDGGVLETTDRPQQQLRVTCERLPNIASALKWTSKLQIVFTAHEQPYWEEINEVSVSLHGTGEKADVYVPGLAKDTLVSVTVRNMSQEVINQITVEAGETRMVFRELGLEPEKVLVVEYDENMIQKIRVGTVSRAKNRTPESSDDLLLRCGETGRVSVAAERDVRATFHVRGLWP